jgi:hypothetical protein
MGNTMNNHQLNALRSKFNISTAVLASFISLSLVAASGPAVAKPSTAASCQKKEEACFKRCIARYPGTTDKAVQQQAGCALRTCTKQYENCIKDSTKGDGGGKKTQTPGDPLNSKGAGNRTPPVGGTKGNPKSPPKVNDTRMPPRGGVNGSKTSGSGVGTGGPILRSHDGGGSDFRSSGLRQPKR